MVQENLGNFGEQVKFQKNRKDPCLFYKSDKNGEIIICLYVDESAMMGEEKALDQTEKDLKTNFTVTVEEMMNYVGCDYIVTSKGLNLHQPKLIQRIKEKFGPEIEKFPVKNTPTTAGKTIGGMKEVGV